MNAAFEALTGEDGDNPPHSAVSQVTSGLGHSHVGLNGNKIHTIVKRNQIKSAVLRSEQQEPEVRSAFKRASASSRPLTDDTWCSEATPTLNRHSCCHGNIWV